MRNRLPIHVALTAAMVLTVAATGCASKKRAPDPMSTVSGTLKYPDKVKLSPEAVAYVRLADVTKGDAQGVTIVQREVKAMGAGGPIPFELSFKDKVIDPKHDYVVDARIIDRGKLMFISAGSKYPVVTKGHPETAEIAMKIPGIAN
jgi:putative lipoprotein